MSRLVLAFCEAVDLFYFNTELNFERKTHYLMIGHILSSETHEEDYFYAENCHFPPKPDIKNHELPFLRGFLFENAY